MTVQTNSNIPVLDSLRAFAALSVCLFHFVCTTTDYIQTEWILNTFSVGQYGVQAFFVISGFVIPWSMFNAGYKIKDFFSFLLKRLARLEPPYIFSIILALVVLFLREKMLGKTNVHMDLSLPQVALHLGYLIPFFEDYKWLNQVYWTLAIEFQYYILTAVLFVPLIKSGNWTRYIIYAAVIGLSFIFPEKFIFFWLPFFLLGILLFLFKAKLIQQTEFYISSAIALGFCFYKYPAASAVYASIPVLAVLFMEQVKIKGLHFAGKFSYSIYLVHPILGASLINILSHHFTSAAGKFAVILSGIVFTLISSWITYIIVEKPSKKLSSSIKYKP